MLKQKYHREIAHQNLKTASTGSSITSIKYFSFPLQYGTEPLDKNTASKREPRFMSTVSTLVYIHVEIYSGGRSV